ncbi:Rha family transcriptional regulator [Pediococcus cellicola]|nr:Rha family transcriptional regulator [Pediococcus cellicola]GEL14220.1 hypothetical protein PCE01_00220 [Pediococcus cellicola]
MNNLVVMKDQQAVTSSLQVANFFGKKHKNVIQTIETKMSSAENSAQLKRMFILGNYQDRSGKPNKMFYMNRDGFSFIAMGFTGREADEFMLEYIEAFNRMESQVRTGSYQISHSMSEALQLAWGILGQYRNFFKIRNAFIPAFLIFSYHKKVLENTRK